MSDKDTHHNSHNPNKKNNGKFNKLFPRKKFFQEIIRLITFENSIAAKATPGDISRAHLLFESTQKKIINSRISQIFFN